MPPHMHPRKQRSGKVFYYMYVKDENGKRKEIALGADYFAALKKYAEMNIIDAPQVNVTFGDVINKYMAQELPKLKASTQSVHKSDMKHLSKFFATAPLDQVEPSHIKEFLERHKATPTTANRCKRLFSTLWNHARGWPGYTTAANPCTGIRGYTLATRNVYITDQIYKFIYDAGSEGLRDAMDLAYLTGQRPGDTLLMHCDDIVDGNLVIRQGKTTKPLRITVTGELAALIERINQRKSNYTMITGALLINHHGKKMTKAVLRSNFEDARAAAALAHPEHAADIRAAWFYDLRAKAADDTADQRGEAAASDLLGHDSVKTTKKHYLRKGKIIAPTR
jgi:integrase